MEEYQKTKTKSGSRCGMLSPESLLQNAIVGVLIHNVTATKF